VDQFEHDGTCLAYARAGDVGDPVVLVHGELDDHRLWDRIVGGLSSGMQTLVYDRRGHGGSSGPPRHRPVRDDAVDLAALLEATGLYPTHVVASGYAGGVALRLAIDRPELVRSVVAHEPPLLGLLEEPTSMASVAELAAQTGRPPEEVVRGFLRLFGGPTDQWAELSSAWRAELLANVATLREELGDPEATGTGPEGLEDVAVPVLLTVGESSPALAHRVANRLEEILGNGQSLRLSGAGHLAPRSEPDLFAGVLGTFLLERNVPTT
jgi:pimeloyl-ACP methyl ester carboxylesterase